MLELELKGVLEQDFKTLAFFILYLRSIYLPGFNGKDVVDTTNVQDKDGKIMRVIAFLMDLIHQIVPIVLTGDPLVLNVDHTEGI